MLRRVVLLSTILGAAAHGSMNHPPPRQMRGLNVDGSDCDPSKFSGNKNACRPACMGEACDWFNDGCYVGCDSCSNAGDWNDDCTEGCYGHFRENKCKVNGVLIDEGATPPMPTETLPLAYRTYDIRGLSPSHGVTGKSMTQNKPWTAPGHSPVTNPCGIASGVTPQPGGGDGHGKKPPIPVGSFQGQNGTDLKPIPGVSTTWKAGTPQEVAWGIAANHGGGYVYRMCPKSPTGAAPTEECFQSNVLSFFGNTTTIRMVQPEARKMIPDFTIPAMDVNIGTKPAGSSWRRNPVPACNCDLGFLCGKGGGKWGTVNNGTKPYWNDTDAPTKTPACPTGTQFPPPHPHIYGYGTGYQGASLELEQFKAEKGKGALSYSLVDKVMAPMVKGEYILSFRWDCEQTSQVWNSCADIVVV